MKSPTPAEMQDTLAAFFVPDEPEPLTPVDRSTLENYATCPARARFIETGRVLVEDRIMAAGNEVHRVLGEVTTNWVRSQGSLLAWELVEQVERGLRESRPDVQPEAITAMRPSVWAWAHFVCHKDDGEKRHQDNLLRWDGGEGEHSGQLAWDLPNLQLRLTSEIDLLYSGPSKELLHELDYKTGHKIHSAADVRASFQFRFHAWLILNNYPPPVQAVEISVWNTRQNKRSWRVEFSRRDLQAIDTRIQRSAEKYYLSQELPPEQCEVWPGVDKCPECPAAIVCPAYVTQLELVCKTPEQLVDLLPAWNAKISGIESMLTRLCRERGSDVVSASGNAWGFFKPKRATPARCGLYAVRGAEEANGEEPEDQGN